MLKPKEKLMGNSRFIDSFLFVDDQVLLAKNEDGLQHNVTNLNHIFQLYDMRISTDKMKAMEIEGRHTSRIKIRTVELIEVSGM
jgi:hypothetical protein